MQTIYSEGKQFTGVHDYKELRRRIQAQYPTLKHFSFACGISTRALTDKLGDISPWKSIEIERIIDCLDDTSIDDITALFFTPLKD